MAWLFERTVEAAAWVAMFAAWSSLGMGIYWFYLYIATVNTQPDYGYLTIAFQAAVAFVGFALALGGLACVDRFLFDSED